MEWISAMGNRILKSETEVKEDYTSVSPEDFLAAWEEADSSFPVQIEVSRVPEESRVVVYADPGSAGADRFRMAQIRLKNLQEARKLKSLLITSPLPGDGKSTVALNLATVLSENGKVRVLLLEADVYRPTMVKRLGLNPWPGLSECLRRRDDPMQASRRIDPLGFYLLPAGQPTEEGSGILQSNLAAQLIKRLASTSFKWIVIDSPPTTPIADILALKAQTDGTLLVARAGETPREAIEESTRNLGRDHILGIFLNGVEGLNSLYSKYYGYGRSAAAGKPAKAGAIVDLGLREQAK
jgi:Mrp family chromosome partitioning ATPase